MKLAPVIIVLIHLLYATAWTVPTRLDNELLPVGGNKPSESHSDLKEEDGLVRRTVESIEPKKDLVPEGGHSSRVYRLKEPFGVKKVKAVVKVVKIKDWRHEQRLRAREIMFSKRAEQYLALGIGESWRNEAHKTYYIVMRDMGRTTDEMLDDGHALNKLRESAYDAIKWYRDTYGIGSIDHHPEHLRNFVFDVEPNGKIIAHMIDWECGFVIKGVKPHKKVNLNQRFLEENWHEDGTFL